MEARRDKVRWARRQKRGKGIEEPIEEPVAGRACHLLDDVIEVAARKDLLNLLVKPPVRGQVGGVSL